MLMQPLPRFHMHNWSRILLSLAFLPGTVWPQSGFLASPAFQPSGASTASTATQATDSTSTVLRVKTRLVIVDVVARDKKDRTVTDLTESDFRIKEDGKEQKISVFALQRPIALEAAAPTPLDTLPQNIYRNTPHVKANSALNVILLDGLNSTLLNQFYVREEMVKFLAKLPQGQPIAIYALGRKLRLLQDFTTDLTDLKRIIQNFKGESSHVLKSPTGTPEVPMTLQGIAAQIAQELAPGFKQQIENFAQETGSDQMDVRIQYTTAALASLARMLAGYPGRKNLIWITEAVPVHLFAENYQPVIQMEGGQLVKRLPDGASEARTRRSYDDQLALVSN